MSTKTILTILSFSIVFSFVNSSCHSVKTAVSCPEISIKKSDYRAHRKARNSHVLFANKTYIKYHPKHRSKKVNDGEIKNLNLPVVSVADTSIHFSKVEFMSGLIASNDRSFHPLIPTSKLMISNEEVQTGNSHNTNIQEVKCDTIFLKSGAIIIGKVEEIGQSELKYKRNNNLTGPVISILKSNVSKIHYSNGTFELFGPDDTYIPNQANYSSNNSASLKNEGLGLAGFISGVAGLFIASIPLGIISVIFGSISLSKIKKNPQSLKGKGFAKAAIIIGLIDVLGMILLLASIS